MMRLLPIYILLTGVDNGLQHPHLCCMNGDSQRVLVAKASLEAAFECKNCTSRAACKEQVTKIARKSNVIDVMFGRRPGGRLGSMQIGQFQMSVIAAEPMEEVCEVATALALCCGGYCACTREVRVCWSAFWKQQYKTSVRL